MALFRDEPVHEVARRLNICAKGLASENLLARSGVTNARVRLGAAPVEWLFRETGKQWGHERYPKDEWHGLRVMAVDGALFRTQDNKALREHFGTGNTSTERQTPFPMLRLVAFMNVRSHTIVDAQISPYWRGEIPLAERFLDSIPDRSVTLFDKGFCQCFCSCNKAMTVSMFKSNCRSLIFFSKISSFKNSCKERR